MSNKVQPLLVTTLHRGVFFGYGVKTAESTIELENARMCTFWSADMHGVLGLASHGPSETCRIGYAAKKILLKEVTMVAEVTPEAEANWNKEPWSK